MTPYEDIRTSRDFMVSSAWLLLMTAMLVLACSWYVNPPRAYRVPPLHGRVAYVWESADQSVLAPIIFSLPSKNGFSRTVQPGDPRLVPTLEPRTEDVRVLPRLPGTTALSVPNPEPAPAFQPWPDEGPVFAPVETGALAWTILAEPVDGAGCVLPAGLAEAAQWPAAGAWTAVVRLEAGSGGRVEHLFVMPPVPENGVAGRLAALLKKARFEGAARACCVKISRVEAPVARGREGANP